MSGLVYVIAYLALIVFLAAVLYRIIHYIKNPMHVRWELYPVAHEEGEKAKYGGSYYEEVDWWKKPRNKSRANELKVMAQEIFFLKAVWENNRPLWWPTYTFHLGLYFGCALIGLTLMGAIVQLTAGTGAWLLRPIFVLSECFGPLGFVLLLLGAFSLYTKRLLDEGMRNYTGREHLLNLILFMVLGFVSLICWLTVDRDLSLLRNFAANLIGFKMGGIGSFLVGLQMLIFFLILAYIPLTHMSHFFMKYFLYHDIRWGDEPNVNNLATQQKIGVVLNYPVSWGAPHIAGHGKTTWAEVATFNPVAEPEDKKE
jgi:nitrate reductase gamma subunit